jgi:hypothetical protein
MGSQSNEDRDMRVEIIIKKTAENIATSKMTLGVINSLAGERLGPELHEELGNVIDLLEEASSLLLNEDK